MSTKYKTVVVDPPWPMMKMRRRVRPNQVGWDYPTMSLEEIAALDIDARLADDAFVFLCTTQRFLPAAFEIMKGWGLDYQFLMVWHKNGGMQLPNYPQFNGEFILVGSKGAPDWQDSFMVVFRAPRRGQSVKPDEFYGIVRRATLPPRLDMFARRSIFGFEAWGDEAPEKQEHQVPMLG